MSGIKAEVFILSIICLLTIAAFAQSTTPGGESPPAQTTNETNSRPRGDSSFTEPEEPQLLTRTGREHELRIAGGDLIHVSVFGAPEYANDVRVADNGTISLPLVGQMEVSGRTPREVASDLQVRLSQGGYFNNPQVEVLVKEFATQGISVLGEVQKPGVYPLLGARTLFDAISSAQGTTQTAGDKVYITHRGRPAQPEVVKISYDATGLAQSNVPVFPGDTIVVEKAGMVYVVGNVQKPAGIVMADEGLTVLKAIALAQGFTPNAALDRARLVRKTSDGQTAIPLPLKKMLDAKAPDMRLQPGDIVFVPNSVAASAFKKSLELALQTASGVIIYGRF